MYLPVGVYWLWLAIRYRSLTLPLLANPNVFLGGMVGESKVDVLDQAGGEAKKRILPYATIRVGTGSSILSATVLRSALEAMKANGVHFPVVAKPDQGCRGMGVKVVRTEQELADYLLGFPSNKVCVLQALSQYQAEAGIFYVRRPGERRGRIVSLTLKYRATVVGDGERTLTELIESDARAKHLEALYKARLADKLGWRPGRNEEVPLVFTGSHCRGSIFKDGGRYISEELTDAIDEFVQGFPQFYYGRLDIKFSDLPSLQGGKNFEVIELNGVSSEQTHIWDSRGTLWAAIRALLWQYKTLFQIGNKLRTQGHKPPPIGLLLSAWRAEMSSSAQYPHED